MGSFQQRCPGVLWSFSWCLDVVFSAEFQPHRAHRNEVFSLEEDLSQPLVRRGPELLEFHLFLDERCFIQRQVRQCGKGWTGPWKNNMAAVLQHAEHGEGLDYPLSLPSLPPLSLVLRQDLGCIPGWPQTYLIANPPVSPKCWDYRYVLFLFHGNCCLGALTAGFQHLGL